MYKKLTRFGVILSALVMTNALSGCESVPVNEYCLLDWKIKPTVEEIDTAIDAGLVPLLLRIDDHDAVHQAICPHKKPR